MVVLCVNVQDAKDAPKVFGGWGNFVLLITKSYGKTG